jgi:hypothetical protein
MEYEALYRPGHWPEGVLVSDTTASDPREAETRRIGDAGEVRAMTGEWELRVVPGTDADGERVAGCAI